MRSRTVACAVFAASVLGISVQGRGELTLNEGSVQFTNGLLSGEIALLSVSSGVPDGAVNLEGETGADDDGFVLQVTLFSGSVRRVGVGAWSEQSTGIYSNGAGTFPDDPGADVSMLDFISGPSWRLFQFDGGKALGAGQSTDRFYVSFDRDAVSAGDLLNFSITPGNGLGGTFSVSAELGDVDGLTCPEDTNGDMMVNVLDVTNVVIDWGTDGSSNNGDVTGDGTVNVGDLVAVMEEYGACEG